MPLPACASPGTYPSESYILPHGQRDRLDSRRTRQLPSLSLPRSSPLPPPPPSLCLPGCVPHSLTQGRPACAHLQQTFLPAAWCAFARGSAAIRFPRLALGRGEGAQRQKGRRGDSVFLGDIFNRTATTLLQKRE